MRTRLCLVTDRRRLAAAMGQCERDALALLRAQVAGAIRGGIDFIQVRELDLDASRLADLSRDLLSLERPPGVRILVNDRLDVALAVGADGVHLRESGVPVARARRVAPDASFVIGKSVHTEAGARQSGAADYLITGHVRETVSKPGRPPLGIHGLARIVRAAYPTPVLAIGGVTSESVGTLIEAGAAGAAAIGAFIPPAPVTDLSAAVQKMTENLRIRFDSHG